MFKAIDASCFKAASGWGGGMRSSSVSDGASAARRTSTGKAVSGSLSSEIRIMAIGKGACGYQADAPIIARDAK
jgi:hypothetical protein